MGSPSQETIEVLSIETFGEYKNEVQERIDEGEKLALRNAVEEEQH